MLSVNLIPRTLSKMGEKELYDGRSTELLYVLANLLRATLIITNRNGIVIEIH